MAEKSATQQKFSAALDSLIDKVKLDRSILAAILCGSLSHDMVWAKSDIDLLLVTIDDKKTGKDSLSLYADGINVHACLLPRSEFRRTVEGAIRNSFLHSLLAKGRLLYTHDETITALCEQLQTIGTRDIQWQLLSAAASAVAWARRRSVKSMPPSTTRPRMAGSISIRHSASKGVTAPGRTGRCFVGRPSRAVGPSAQR